MDRWKLDSGRDSCGVESVIQTRSPPVVACEARSLNDDDDEEQEQQQQKGVHPGGEWVVR
jgi:hypothetical protein